MKSINEILETEYSEPFDALRKKAMVVGHYKYGLIRNNANQKYVDSIETALLRIEKYQEIGNTEELVDAANFLMIEFMHPQRQGAYYKGTDSEKVPCLVGISELEMKRFKEENE